MDQLTYFKNKKLLAVIAVFLVFVVLGGIFLLSRNQKVSTSSETEVTQDSGLPKLNPEDIGIEVTVRPDSKALMFRLSKASDITHVEYTIEYDKVIDGTKVPEGIFGEMNIAKDGITKTDYREFGTCSSGHCRYDNVVSDITLTLKVTKKDGKDYEVKKIVKL